MAERSVASLVAVVPFAIAGIIAVVMYNLPTARETRARAMAADPLVIEAKQIPAFPYAQQLGDCDYWAKGLTIRLYECKYTTPASLDPLRRFYGDELEKRGWTRSSASVRFADWCKDGQRATIEYALQPSRSWRYALSYSVGVPPSPCGV
jgi:hypothetical protein